MSEFSFVSHPPVWIQRGLLRDYTWELWRGHTSHWYVSHGGAKAPIPLNWEIICIGQP